jgi:hypothetical protein
VIVTDQEKADAWRWNTKSIGHDEREIAVTIVRNVVHTLSEKTGYIGAENAAG